MARFEPVPDRQKHRLSGAFLERMMGLEPTTFCMATRPRLQPSAASCRLHPGRCAEANPSRTRSSSDSSAPWANVSEYVSGPSASTVAAMALRQQKPAFAGLLEEPTAVIPRTED